MVELLEEGIVLEMLSEVVSEGIIMVNDAHHIVSSNATANKMFGYEKDELNGKPLEILIPQNVRQGHHKDVGKFVKSGKARRMGPGLDLVGLRKDGDEFPLEISLNPFNLMGKRYV